jgi:hypothetical protein
VRRNLIVSGVLCCIWVFALGNPYPSAKSDAVTVAGTLLQVVGIGGETTGWAIRLDAEMKVHGKSTRSIEVAGPARDFVRLENKHVKATGTIIVRRGVERGDWPVLEIDSIQEAN